METAFLSLLGERGVSQKGLLRESEKDIFKLSEVRWNILHTKTSFVH